LPQVFIHVTGMFQINCIQRDQRQGMLYFRNLRNYFFSTSAIAMRALAGGWVWSF